MRTALIFLIILVWPACLRAQLDNRAFFDWPGSDTLTPHQVDFSLDQLGFFRNNEFFNDWVEGYTLFGSQWIPSIRYHAGKHVVLEGGAFLQQDFGKSGLRPVLPVFSAEFRKNGHTLRFGALRGGLAHRLIEPLYDFENQLRRRMEYGFQWTWKSRPDSGWGLDTWVDWRTQIDPNSPFQEEIQAGFNVYDVPLFTGKNLKFRAHWQTTIQHKGGQIDNSGLPLLTWIHTAPGLEAAWETGRVRGFQAFRLSAFGVGFFDQSPQKSFEYRWSFSPYATAQAVFSWGTLMVNYWQTAGYAHPYGGVLFRTLTSRTDRPVRDMGKRQLIFIRYLKDWKIADHAWITARFEPFFDLQTQRWEFSHGLYLTFRNRISRKLPPIH